MTLEVGKRVRAVDAAPGSPAGTVVRLTGKPGLGGGIHARVAWDNGSTKLHRPDTLKEIS